MVRALEAADVGAGAAGARLRRRATACRRRQRALTSGEAWSAGCAESCSRRVGGTADRSRVPGDESARASAMLRSADVGSPRRRAMTRAPPPLLLVALPLLLAASAAAVEQRSSRRVALRRAKRVRLGVAELARYPLAARSYSTSSTTRRPCAMMGHRRRAPRPPAPCALRPARSRRRPLQSRRSAGSTGADCARGVARTCRAIAEERALAARALPGLLLSAGVRPQQSGRLARLPDGGPVVRAPLFPRARSQESDAPAAQRRLRRRRCYDWASCMQRSTAQPYLTSSRAWRAAAAAALPHCDRATAAPPAPARQVPPPPDGRHIRRRPAQEPLGGRQPGVRRVLQQRRLGRRRGARVKRVGLARASARATASQRGRLNFAPRSRVQVLQGAAHP